MPEVNFHLIDDYLLCNLTLNLQFNRVIIITFK